MKSDYVWVWNGELIRFVVLTLLGLGVELITQLLTSYEALERGWWIPPVTAAGLALVQFVQGKLPAKAASGQ